MIFGTQGPAYKYNNTVYNLDYATIQPTWSDPYEIEKKSIVNGAINYVTKGDYAEFTVDINLWKYGGGDINNSNSAAVKAKFQELYAINHKDVEFFPHRDAPSLRDSSGNIVLCHVTQIKPYYKSDYKYIDALQITFKTNKYIDISKSLL